MKKNKQYNIIFLVYFVVVLLAIIIIGKVFNFNMFWCYALYGVTLIFFFIFYSIFSNLVKKYSEEADNTLASNYKNVLNECKIGVLRYNESYNITFVSQMFLDYKFDCVGEKLLAIFPDLEDMLYGVSKKETIVFNDYKFEVLKISDSNVLVFKDITKEYDLDLSLKDNAYVLGFANFDNYDEANASEDSIAYVNSSIKMPVIEYFKKYQVVYRTLRANRLQLILTYKQLEQLLKDRFSILDKVKSESQKGDLSISLSMSFTYGSNDLAELDKEAIDLLELAQTRGGDQVIVRQIEKDPIFFGGSSEAKEKKSKVKARVISNTIKQLIKSADNVFIVGHVDSDCDCVGAMLGISTFSKVNNKNTYVILKDVSIEKVALEAINKYSREIDENETIIDENEAIDKCGDNSLVILCDHHSIDQSNCKELIKKSKRVLVIDHHRRKADLDYEAVLLYLEASASSTCELVSEFFEFDDKIKVPEYLANMMYLGIIIDTNHFKARLNSRTFDAARRLKELGADSKVCEELSQEPYELVKVRTQIFNNGVQYKNGIIISAVEDGEYTRTLASQACDSLVETKGTKAAFVICKANKEDVILSARSNGDINVQVILEGMNGGGHMTSAGLQRKNESIEDIKKELIENIDKYFNEGEKDNESNSIE